MAKAVSQSNTMWVKKGTIVNGKAVPKGYLAQYGKPEKKVTNKVKMVTDTESGKKAGKTYEYKQGRTVKAAPAAASRPGGGGGGGGGGSAPARGKVKADTWQKGAAGRANVRGAAPASGASAGMSSYRPMASTAKAKDVNVASPKAGGARPRGVAVPTQKVTVNGKTTRIAKTGIRGLGNQRVYDVPGAIATVATAGVGGGMGARLAGKALSKTPIGKLGSSVGEGAKEGIASFGRSAAGAAPKSAAKAAAKGAKPAARPGRVGSVSKPNRAAQIAKEKRTAAAQKGAATRKANAAAAAKKKGGKK